MCGQRQQFVDAQRQMLNRYSVEAQSQFVDVPSINGRAHVLVDGKGPAVVLINGIGTPGAMWAPLMAELNEFCLLAIDLPGYGLTDTTNNFSEDLRGNAVRFLKEVLDGLGLNSPPIIANSLGSLWTSWLSLDHPERVKAMIPIGCPAIVLNTSAPLPMRLLSVKILGQFLTWLQPPSKKQVEQLSKTLNEYPLVSELADLLLKTEQLPGFRQTFLTMLNTLLRLSGSRSNMRLTAEQLAQIKQPTLIFWGQDDPFGAPDVGEQMVKIMTAAELHIIDGGHAPWLTQSKRISPIVTRFLHQLA